jgi:deoxyribodipyrimidine photolyase-related protein
MKELTILFPHQLYYPHPALEKKRGVVLVEEALFFTQYHFHKQKLILHRASLRAFQELLEKKGFSAILLQLKDHTN